MPFLAASTASGPSGAIRSSPSVRATSTDGVSDDWFGKSICTALPGMRVFLRGQLSPYVERANLLPSSYQSRLDGSAHPYGQLYEKPWFSARSPTASKVCLEAGSKTIAKDAFQVVESGVGSGLSLEVHKVALFACIGMQPCWEYAHMRFLGDAIKTLGFRVTVMGDIVVASNAVTVGLPDSRVAGFRIPRVPN